MDCRDYFYVLLQSLAEPRSCSVWAENNGRDCSEKLGGSNAGLMAQYVRLTVLLSPRFLTQNARRGP